MFKNTLIIFFIAMLLFIAGSGPVLAYDFLANSGIKETGGAIGGYDIDPSTGATKKSLSYIIGTAVKTVLSFVGVIFLILMIYGGFQWMTASGNEQQIEKAKNLIAAAAIGLIIVMSAYAITWLVYSYSSQIDPSKL